MTRRHARFTVAVGFSWLLFAQPAFAESVQVQIDAAAPGAEIELAAGVHEGPVRIDKPLTLVGQGKAIIDGGGQGHVVHILAPGVTVQGLIIRNSGHNLARDHAGILVEADRARILDNRVENSLHGIYLKKASDSLVRGNRIAGKTERLVPVEDVLSDGVRLTADGEMCIIDLDVNQRGNGIHLWNSTGIRLEENEIRDTRDGMYFSFSSRSSVRRNHVHRVRYGLHYMYSDENVFENNRFENNAAGAAIMYSRGLFVRGNQFANNRGRRAYGLLLNTLDDTTITGNELRHNTVGVYFENSNRNHFVMNAVESNYIGVRLTASSLDNAFSRNRFTRNLHPVELDRDSSGNHWAPEGVGNYWSGARMLDIDGDGRAELPHREADLLGPYRRGFPLAGLLSKTPAMQLLEFVQARVRLPGIPAITDPAPLTRPPFASGGD